MQPRHHHVAQRACFCRGQAMVESCIVIVFLCLLFLGLFQLVHAFVARDVLYHASARAARARTVGFNMWMVEKTMRVAAIPNAGRLTEPAMDSGDPALAVALDTMGPGELWDFALLSTPRSASLAIELARIPEYLASANALRARSILDYERWDTITLDPISMSSGITLDPASAGTLTVRVKQDHDLLVATEALMDGLFVSPSGSRTNITLIGRYDLEAHYRLYLDTDSGSL